MVQLNTWVPLSHSLIPTLLSHSLIPTLLSHSLIVPSLKLTGHQVRLPHAAIMSPIVALPAAWYFVLNLAIECIQAGIGSALGEGVVVQCLELTNGSLCSAVDELAWVVTTHGHLGLVENLLVKFLHFLHVLFELPIHAPTFVVQPTNALQLQQLVGRIILLLLPRHPGDARVRLIQHAGAQIPLHIPTGPLGRWAHE